jgi:hypothetical protein
MSGSVDDIRASPLGTASSLISNTQRALEPHRVPVLPELAPVSCEQPDPRKAEAASLTRRSAA